MLRETISLQFMTKAIPPYSDSKLCINKKWTGRWIFLAACFFLFHSGIAQDSTWIKVHFIYGSKPKKSCKDEHKWFVGIHGGHVGIEYDTGKVIDFAPKGKFHYIEKPRNCHSAYTLRSMTSFWNTFADADSASLKAWSVTIYLDSTQRHKLDSIVSIYSQSTPYDYAFLGMRCASASYDILAEIGVLNMRTHFGTWSRIFYPKMLRKRMMKLARKQDWQTWQKAGSECRIWEKD